jgi:peptidoglycan/xylan/chitin deacetylase (PgdA/CDA1 family)
MSRVPAAGVVKRLALSAAALSGGFSLARQLTAQPARIVMYHHFSADTPARADRTSARMFRQQLLHLRRHFRPVRLSELAAQLAAGEAPAAGSVAITVDDGHADFLRVAVPILRELGIPATLFVLSELSNSGGWLWVDKWEYLRAHAPPHDGGASLVELRRMAPTDRDRCLDELARDCGVALPERPPGAYELVDWEQLKAMLRSGLVDVGSHTRTHRILSDADDAEAWSEIDGSRRALEQRLGVEISSFCFPNGQRADYRAEQLEMVARAGYACGVASHFGYVTRASHRFALPRVGRVFGDMTRFRQELDGPEYLWRRARGEPVS